MSNIVITGATGVIGWRAVERLVRGGHRVTAVTRSDRSRRLVENLGARAVEADVFDRVALARAFAGADAVVNLLTHIPPAERMLDPGAWDDNDRLRREASAAIAHAASDAGVARLVQESLGLVYADGGDTWLDEDAPLEATHSAASAIAAEHHATALFAGETVVLRFGVFKGPDSVLTLGEIAQARAGSTTRLGHAGTRVPTVWLDDAAAAIAAALCIPPGTYNVVDDEPPTRAELEAALAAAVGRTDLAVNVAPDVPELEPLARSLRLSNRRLRGTGAWAPTVRAGLDGWALIAEERAAA
jgi:nucleoside-diphosphate-sugar epimerase